MAFSYKRTLTIDHTKVPNTNQSNFPVLVAVTDDDFKTVANGGKVESSSGYDICFYSDSDGTTPLYWEVESYTASTGSLIAWVKIPTVSYTSDTVFYCFFGDSSITTFQSTASSVWDSHYMGVYHFSDNSGIVVANDSTLRGNNLSVTDEPSSSSGKYGWAANVDGNALHNMHSASSDFQLIGDMTLEAWVNPTNFSAERPLITKADGGAHAASYDWTVQGTTGKPYFQRNNGTGYAQTWATNVLSTGSYQHVAVTMESTTVTHYLNGATNGSDVNGSTIADNPTLDVYFGQRKDGYAWLGLMDEARVSDIARSADWIATEYANQSDPSSFLTLGSTGGLAQPIDITASDTNTLSDNLEVLAQLLLEQSDTMTLSDFLIATPNVLNLYVSISGDTLNSFQDSTSKSTANPPGPYSVVVADVISNKRNPRPGDTSLSDYLGRNDVVVIQFYGGENSLQLTEVLSLDEELAIDLGLLFEDTLVFTDSAPTTIIPTMWEAYDSMVYNLGDSLQVAWPLDGVALADTLQMAQGLVETNLFGGTSSISDSMLLSDVPALAMGGALAVGDSLNYYVENFQAAFGVLSESGDSITLSDAVQLNLALANAVAVGDSMTLIDSLDTPLTPISETNYLRRYLNDIWQ